MPFVVVLAQTGTEYTVDDDDTILEVLRAAGLDVPSSCEQGVCGTCETTVLAGEPEHRDLLMSPDEHAENKTMMICCSGSLSPRLVLDL